MFSLHRSSSAPRPPLRYRLGVVASTIGVITWGLGLFAAVTLLAYLFLFGATRADWVEIPSVLIGAVVSGWLSWLFFDTLRIYRRMDANWRRIISAVEWASTRR